METPPSGPPEVQGWPEALSLLGEWRTSVAAIQDGHYKTAHRYTRYSRSLGVLIVLITTVVGSAVLASLAEEVEWARVGLGILSLIAASLTALQTFWGHRELAEKHRHGGIRFGMLLRRMDQALRVPAGDAKQVMDSIRIERDAIQSELPMLPASQFEVRERQIGRGEA